MKKYIFLLIIIFCTSFIGTKHRYWIGIANYQGPTTVDNYIRVIDAETKKKATDKFRGYLKLITTKGHLIK